MNNAGTGSHPEDTLGGHSKSDQVGSSENQTKHKHGKSVFNERLPQPKGAYLGGQTTLRSANNAKSKGKNHLKERGY